MRRLLHVYWRFARGMTLGVRGLVIDGTGHVFPGQAQLCRRLAFARWRGRDRRNADDRAHARVTRGGQHRAERTTVVVRRLFEPARFTARSRCVVRRSRVFHQSAPPQPDSEIVAHGFFALNYFSEDTTLATRARIAEVLQDWTIAEHW